MRNLESGIKTEASDGMFSEIMILQMNCVTTASQNNHCCQNYFIITPNDILIFFSLYIQDSFWLRCLIIQLFWMLLDHLSKAP